MLAGEADTQQAAPVTEVLPPNLGKIIKQSQQDTQESRVRSRPSSTRQGFVVAEQRLRENTDYRVLCGICRRWGDREHLNAHDGFTPQLKLSGSSGFNCQTKIGRARTARMIETIILHLPVSLTECLSICHDSVDWVASRIADSCRYFESWFPASFMALINEKAEMMGREKLLMPQDSPEDARDDEDWSLDANTFRAQSSKQNKKLSKELYLGTKTPSIDFYDDSDDISARDLLAKLTAEQAMQEQQADQVAKPHIYHRARARPGFSYNFTDRTKDFYLNSRCPHGEAQQILSDAANEAIYGARQPILNHTPMRPASQQLTKAEQIICKTVYSKPTRIIDQAPKNIKPLTAPYTSSLDAARHRYELYKNILADGDKKVNTAGRTLRSMNPSSVRLAEEALHLNELEADIKMNVKAYHEGRIRAKSVHGSMVESRRYGATGFKEVQMGRGVVVVPDYFTPQTRRHTKALYEQYNNEYDFSTTEIDQPDELLDFNEDFTGLGIAKLNQSKLRALAGIVASPKHAGTEEGGDMAQEDASDEEEDSDDSTDKARKRAVGKNNVSAANAFMYRKAIAEYVTSQVNLPQYDNKLQPMAFPQDTEKSGAFYSSPQQSMAAAGDLKTKDLLSGGKHGFDPRLYQVLDASKNILNNDDLLLDSDSEDNLGRRPAKAPPDQHLYANLYLDSDPSDPDAPEQEDKIEAPELSFARESVILEGLRDTLAPIADIVKDQKDPLTAPDPVGPLIMKQAASMKAKAIKAEIAAREEQAALAAKLAREKARKAAESGEKAKSVKAPKVEKQPQGPSVTDTMSKYTTSGAPVSYETMAADTYKAAATVTELAQHAEVVRDLANSEIERSKRLEEAFVETQRVEMRKTAAFNGLTEACKKVAERTGDLNSMRTAGITHVAKAHLGNTVFYKPGLERYERQRLSDEEAEDNSAIVTKINMSLKPYLYDNSKPLEKLNKITEITSTPLRKEDDGTVPLFERTYQPINAASHKPGCTNMTMPYMEQSVSAPSLFQRTMTGRHLSGTQFKEDIRDYAELGCSPPFVPDINSITSAVSAEVKARNTQRTKPLPQPNRREIHTFFDDRAINNANPQTQVFKMQSIETDSNLKVDAAVASAQNIASLFTLNADKTQKLNAALLKRDLARKNADTGVTSSSGLDDSALPDMDLCDNKATALSTASPSKPDDDSIATGRITPLIAQADRTVALASLAKSAVSEYRRHASDFQQERLTNSLFGRPSVLPSMSLIGKELTSVKDSNLMKDLQRANISVIPSRNATAPSSMQRDSNPLMVNIASIMARTNVDPCPREVVKKGKKSKKGKKGAKGKKGSKKK